MQGGEVCHNTVMMQAFPWQWRWWRQHVCKTAAGHKVVGCMGGGQPYYQPNLQADGGDRRHSATLVAPFTHAHVDAESHRLLSG